MKLAKKLQFLYSWSANLHRAIDNLVEFWTKSSWISKESLVGKTARDFVYVLHGSVATLISHHFSIFQSGQADLAVLQSTQELPCLIFKIVMFLPTN